jgi:DNA-binding MarR family transcriptional regulator
MIANKKINLMNETQYSTAVLLGEINFRIGKKVHQRIVEQHIDLTTEQFAVLYILSKRKDTIQSDLAEFAGKDKSAVMRHLDALERKNLVVRVNDNSDRRRKILVITKAGQQMMDKALQVLNEVFQEVTQSIPEEKMNIFREVLGTLKQNLDCKKILANS